MIRYLSLLLFIGLSWGQETVTDIDGNVYNTVSIGDQLWMAENLKVTHYQNGDEIPYSYNDPQYGAYAEYSNDASNVAVYGRLYNWFAVNDERGLCPVNWHVPSDDEFKSLEMYLGMSESEANGEGLRGTDEGGKLKEEGNEHWNSPNTGATNETGFTALPGGRRDYDSYTNQEICCCLNRYGFFWSSSEVYTVNAWYRALSFDYAESNRYHLNKRNGFSVRCVRDPIPETFLVPQDYPTIQAGINASSDGDTVLVAAGTYVENINYNGKNIVVGSLYLTTQDTSYISSTIIDGDSSGSIVVFESFEDSTAVLNGFTFQDIIFNSGDGPQTIININESSPKIINNRFDNFYLFQDVESAVIYCENSNSLIMNNEFTNGSVGNGYVLGGFILSKNSNLTIKNNRIENGYVGFAEPSGYIVSVNSDNIIESNVIINPSMGYCVICAPISILDGSNCILRNNFIFQAYGDGYGAVVASESQYVSHNNTFVSNSVGYANLSSDGIVSNDIIYASSNAVYIDENSTIQVSYSDIEGGWEGVGNIDTDPLFCAPDNGEYTLAQNSPCVGTGENGANMGAFGIGCEAILSIDKDAIPLQYTLHQNYPNPFNPITTLRYDLPENGTVNIIIYDMLGRQVRTLINQTQDAGYRSVIWDATNDYGKPVSAGVYLYQIQAGEFVQTRKMVLLK